jgi:hypothetical protein
MNRQLPFSGHKRRRKTTMIFVLLAIIALGVLAIAAAMYRHPGNRSGGAPSNTPPGVPQSQ